MLMWKLWACSSMGFLDPRVNLCVQTIGSQLYPLEVYVVSLTGRKIREQTIRSQIERKQVNYKVIYREKLESYVLRIFFSEKTF